MAAKKPRTDLRTGLKRISNDANTRSKIKTTHIIKRLTDHVDSDGDLLTPSQVQAALGLLKKTLPDQKAMEISGELNIPQVITKDLSGE